MILDAILANTRREVTERKRLRSQAELEAAIASMATPRAFAATLRQPGVSIIAEIKRRSPSGGELRPGASAADLARLYVRGGAAALSVLTDYRYFGGQGADLAEARAASGLAVLRKDFIVEPYQVYESRAIGADAILLIVRALEVPALHDLLELAAGLQLEALVETHSATEVEIALRAGAHIVGVNNRDLDTLVTDVSMAPKLRTIIPPDRVVVAESGISQPDQIAALARAGIDAVLIGEALLRDIDPSAKLAALVAAGSPLRSSP